MTPQKPAEPMNASITLRAPTPKRPPWKHVCPYIGQPRRPRKGRTKNAPDHFFTLTPEQIREFFPQLPQRQEGLWLAQSVVITGRKLCWTAALGLLGLSPKWRREKVGQPEMRALTAFNLPLETQYTLLRRQIRIEEPLALSSNPKLRLLLLVLRATVKVCLDGGIRDWKYVDWLA